MTEISCSSQLRPKVLNSQLDIEIQILSLALGNFFVIELNSDVNIQKSIQTIFHISIKQVIYVTQLYYIADHSNLILLAYLLINYNFKSYSDV